MSNKIFYEKALQEFLNNRDDALWLKSVVECLGDEEKAKFFYIKLRVEDLEKNIINETANLNSIDNLDLFLKQGHYYFDGSIKDRIEKKFCEILKTKKYSNVLSDLYVNKNFIIITPSSKDTTSIELLGILGGHAGLAAMQSFTQFVRNKQSDKIKDKIDVLKNFVVFDAKSCEIKAKEVKYGFGWLAEWHTWVLIEGDCLFDGTKERISVRFEIDCTLFGARERNKTTISELCSRIGKPAPKFYIDKEVLHNGVF
jgi:hypothetical protein